jgi:hypothetical protein
MGWNCGAPGGNAAVAVGCCPSAERTSVVSGSTVVASFEGYTGATHDAPNLRTNCSIRYRLVKREGTWSSYQQVGLSRYGYPGRGYVANAPCEMSRGGALKTTSSGSKVRTDFGLIGDEATYWRAYLRRRVVV